MNALESVATSSLLNQRSKLWLLPPPTINVSASIFKGVTGAAGAVSFGPDVSADCRLTVGAAAEFTAAICDGFERCSAVIAKNTGATALLKLSSVNFSIVPFLRSGLLNQRTCPLRTTSG